MISVKEIDSYKNYGRVLEIQNGVIRAAVTLDVGPRIIFFGFSGGQNIMNDNRTCFGTKSDEEYEELFGKGKQWENLGGHRIWASPEEWPLTYTPDSLPVDYRLTENGAVFSSDSAEKAGFKKILEIKMDSDDANMQVRMSIKNITDKPRNFAIWGITVCAKGGTLVVPMNSEDTVFLPNRVISLWPYTDISDSRYTISDKYATVKSTDKQEPMKLGFDAKRGNSYYFLNGDVFRKEFDTFHGEKPYFDNGCSFETYNCGAFIEVETLGPAETVAAGEEISHTESWSLYKLQNPELSSDDAIDATLELI